MTQSELTANEIRATETKIVAALAEARKARHHPDCHCREFEGAWCSSVAALWERALERELKKLADHYRSGKATRC